MVEYGDARMKNFASDVILAKNQMHSFANIVVEHIVHKFRLREI